MPPPPLPLALGRLSAACRGHRAAPQAAQARSTQRAACSARRPVRLRWGGCSGTAGAPRAHPDAPAPSPAASPPRGRRASLRAWEVLASRRGCRPQPDPQVAGAAWGSSRPSGLSPRPPFEPAYGQKMLPQQVKIKLGPFHVEQVTGWEETEVPSPLHGGLQPEGCRRIRVPPCGALRRATRGGR